LLGVGLAEYARQCFDETFGFIDFACVALDPEGVVEGVDARKELVWMGDCYGGQCALDLSGLKQS